MCESQSFQPYVFIGELHKDDLWVTLYLQYTKNACSIVNFRKHIKSVRLLRSNPFKRGRCEVHFDEGLLLSQQFARVAVEYRDGEFYQVERYILSGGHYHLVDKIT